MVGPPDSSKKLCCAPEMQVAELRMRCQKLAVEDEGRDRSAARPHDRIVESGVDGIEKPNGVRIPAGGRIREFGIRVRDPRVVVPAPRVAVDTGHVLLRVGFVLVGTPPRDFPR